MEINADFQKGYVHGVTAVFSTILEEMDDKLKEIVLKNLNLKVNE